MELIDSRVRLEILRLISQSENPVGADVLTAQLAKLGISISGPGVRYHLRVLDEQGFTTRFSTLGRLLTQKGWEELHRSLIDTRLQSALAKAEAVAHLVTFDMKEQRGEVAISTSLFPAKHLSTVVSYCQQACRARLCVSNRIGLITEDRRFNALPLAPGKMGITTVSTALIDGLLLSHGLLFRPVYGGLVEIKANRPVRMVEVVDYGRGSLDPIVVLARSGNTQVRDVLQHGVGLILADVREMSGVARERTCKVLEEIKQCGIEGVLEVGEIGQPILGVPVQPQNFGVALVAGINPLVASVEAGIPIEFNLNAGTIDWESLQSIESISINTPPSSPSK